MAGEGEARKAAAQKWWDEKRTAEWKSNQAVPMAYVEYSYSAEQVVELMAEYSTDIAEQCAQIAESSQKTIPLFGTGSEREAGFDEACKRLAAAIRSIAQEKEEQQ